VAAYRAAFAAERAVGFDSAQRIIAPFLICLTERRHRKFDTMEKIMSTPRRQLSFPCPIDVHRECGDEDNSNETDEKPGAFQSAKL